MVYTEADEHEASMRRVWNRVVRYMLTGQLDAMDRVGMKTSVRGRNIVMDRSEAWVLVDQVTVNVGNFRGVSKKDVKALLTRNEFIRLCSDKLRCRGPTMDYIYPWNVVDYLSGMLDVKPKQKGT